MSATAAPDCASLRAQARPIPCEAPVTSATRPERLMQRSSPTGKRNYTCNPEPGAGTAGVAPSGRNAAELERGNQPPYGGHGDDNRASGLSQESATAVRRPRPLG